MKQSQIQSDEYLKNEIVKDLKNINQKSKEADSTLIQQNNLTAEIKENAGEYRKETKTTEKYTNGFTGFFGFFKYIFSSGKPKNDEKIDSKNTPHIIKEENTNFKNQENFQNPPKKKMIQQTFYDELNLGIDEINKTNLRISDNLDKSIKDLREINKLSDNNQSKITSINKDLDKIIKK